MSARCCSSLCSSLCTSPFWQHLHWKHICASAVLVLVATTIALLTDDDRNFGRSSGVRVDGRVEVLEVLGLILQVNDPLVEVELLFDQGDPCSLRIWAPADASTASTAR